MRVLARSTTLAPSWSGTASPRSSSFTSTGVGGALEAPDLADRHAGHADLGVVDEVLGFGEGSGHRCSRR